MRPVSALLIGITIKADTSSRSLAPAAARCWVTEATSAAVTADVELSGPAMLYGSVLPRATTSAATDDAMKLAAMPYASHGANGPLKIKAAKDSPNASERTPQTAPAKTSCPTALTFRANRPRSPVSALKAMPQSPQRSSQPPQSDHRRAPRT